MTNELKPLNAEEQAEFERRRESAAVVQHKCEGCGAWYETAKRDKPFQETFDCDCGARLTFPVPAMDGIRAPTNSELLEMFDPAARLDTGMKAQEAIKRAAAWWDSKGRALMMSEAKRQKQKVGSSDKGLGAAFASADPDDPRFNPSRILHGWPWDQLDRRSRTFVIKVWHHFNVRKPDLIGDADKRFKMQDRGSIN
jgi:hypothetical protein